MEDTSSSISPNNAATSGAAKYLAGLPSRGLFSSNVLSSTPGGMRVYVCDHETSPPEDQFIKTNQQNILIRSLMLKKQRGDHSSKDGKGISSNDNGRKRAAEKALDSKASNKKATTSNQVASPQGMWKPLTMRSIDLIYHVMPESKCIGARNSIFSVHHHVFSETSRIRTPDIKNMTVEKLRALLKEKGLSLRGRKDELIARLRGDT